MSRREFFIKLSMMAEIASLMLLGIGALFCLCIVLNTVTENKSAKLEEPSRQYVIVIEEQQIPVAEYNDSYYVREHGKTNMDDSYCINETNGILEHIANDIKEYFTEYSILKEAAK